MLDMLYWSLMTALAAAGAIISNQKIKKDLKNYKIVRMFDVFLYKLGQGVSELVTGAGK